MSYKNYKMSDLSFGINYCGSKFILLLLLGSYLNLYLHTSFLLYKGQILKFIIIIM